MDFVSKMRIQLDPDNADNVIMATCILHNYIKSGGSQHSHNEEDIIASYSLSNLPRQGGSHQVAAFNVRENFARFFDSPEGALNYWVIISVSCRLTLTILILS